MTWQAGKHVHIVVKGFLSVGMFPGRLQMEKFHLFSKFAIFNLKIKKRLKEGKKFNFLNERFEVIKQPYQGTPDASGIFV